MGKGGCCRAEKLADETGECKLDKRYSIPPSLLSKSTLKISHYYYEHKEIIPVLLYHLSVWLRNVRCSGRGGGKVDIRQHPFVKLYLPVSQQLRSPVNIRSECERLDRGELGVEEL